MALSDRLEGISRGRLRTGLFMLGSAIVISFVVVVLVGSGTGVWGWSPGGGPGPNGATVTPLAPPSTSVAPESPTEATPRPIAFGSPRLVSDSAENWWAYSAVDVNGDGRDDLVVNNDGANGGWIGWYETNSAGTNWTRHVIAREAPTGERFAQGDMAVGDIDGDGDVDVVGIAHLGEANGARQPSTLFWYENRGDRWRPHRIGMVPAYVKDIELADFDGDGKPDIVTITDEGGYFTVYRQAGPSDWTKAVEFTIPNLHEGMDTGDIDGDGDPDVATNGYWVANPGGDLSGNWSVESIDARWHTDQRMAWRSYATKVVTHDITGNGRVEVVIAHSEATTSTYPVSWYEYDDGEWTEHVLVTTLDAVHTLQVVDLNGDDAPEVVVGQNAGQVNDPVFRVLENHGNNIHWTAHTVDEWGAYNAVVGDATGDGLPDLYRIRAHDATRAEMLPHHGANASPLGHWRRHVVDRSKPRTVFVAHADLDGDGFEDIVTGGTWYENPGHPAGSWTARPIGLPLRTAVAVYDFDADGDPDVLGTRGAGSDADSTFVWARNDGDGQFTVLTNVPAGEGDFLQGAAVMETGGQISVGLSWHEAGHGVQLLTVPRDPSATSWSWHRIHPASQDEDLSTGDIDGDGDLDLLQGTRWLERTGDGWRQHTLSATSEPPDRNELVDIDGDGDLDAVVGFEAIGRPGVLAWYEQPTDPTEGWTAHVIAEDVIGPMSLDVADLDGDGDIDIVVGEHTIDDPFRGRAVVFEQVPSGWTRHEIAVGNEHHNGMQLVDLDNDGDLDVVSIGWVDDQLVIYENVGRSADTNGSRGE